MSKPIIMLAEEVRAILDGNKTITRRPIKSKNELLSITDKWDLPNKPKNHFIFNRKNSDIRIAIKCPFGAIGDELWVRETYVIEDTYGYYDSNYKLPKDCPVKKVEDFDRGNYYLIPHYRATEPEPHIVPEDREDEHDDTTRWYPSIHMPRWASRVTLVITDIKVGRLQDITVKDIEKEGCPWKANSDFKHILWFENLWNSLNKKPEYQWSSNPFCWVLSFKRIK